MERSWTELFQKCDKQLGWSSGVIDPEHRSIQSDISESDGWTQHLGDADPVQSSA